MTNALIASNLPIPSAIGSLEAYVSAVHRIPMLTQAEEQDLARRFVNQDDLDAAKQMVLSHLRFVVHVARGYSGYGLQVGDLIQEGNIGLMKAVKRFDPNQGVRLVSFAVHWIRAEMHEFILRNWRIVKVATTKAQRKLFFNLRKSKKRLGWMNNEEVNTVAKELGVPAATVLEMEARLNGRDVAFDSPVDADDDEKPAPAAFLIDHSADPYSAVEAESRRIEPRHAPPRTRQARRPLARHHPAPLAERWREGDFAGTCRRVRRFGRAHPPDRSECDEEDARVVRRRLIAMVLLFWTAPIGAVFVFGCVVRWICGWCAWVAW